MSDLLLKTKLSIPLVRKDLVARPRLVEKLNAGLRIEGGFARKLTLVSAPAGSGKTTLIADWFDDIGLRSAWLSLDEGDNDPARLLAYLIAALQQVDPRIGLGAGAMLGSPQPPPGETVLTSVINDLAEISQPLILAADDYHVIQNPIVHRQVGFLLENQPAQIHLVILTREDPLLPISRLRSRGQLCEIRQKDLRFTRQETGEFLQRVMGLDLVVEDLDILQDRTEGWVTGLQLAAISMQGSADLHQFVLSFAGSHRYILDYLFEEIFSQQPAGMQDFMTKTSILDQLAADLCDFVIQKSDSRARLEGLERANIFILPLDPSREWFRYYHLFRDLLRHQLHLREDTVPENLHRRASMWFEAGGFLAEAIEHALAAGDWEATSRLIDKVSERMLKRGEVLTLIGWFKKIPGEVIAADPSLCLTFAWALLLASQFDAAEPLLEQASQMAKPESAFLGEVYAAQAYLARARGDDGDLIEKSQQALSLLPEADLVSRGNVALNLGLAYWHKGCLEEADQALREAQDISARVRNNYGLYAARIFIARTQATRGKLREPVDRYQELLEAGGMVPILALAYYDLSVIYYEWNRLQEAEDYLRRGLELSTRSGIVEFQNAGYIQRVFLALAQGDTAAALEAAEKSNVLSRDYSSATRARSAACRVQLALAMGELEMAAHWADQVTGEVDAHSFYRFLCLTPSRLLIAGGRKQAALEELKACYERATQAGWGYAVIAIRVLQALAAGTVETALEYLGDALHLGQTEGFIRAFADAGEPLIPLLQEAALRGVLPEYVGQILSAMREAHHAPVATQSLLEEPLSEREIEVLRLVTAGLSNREIAEKLIISTGTAKTHVHNIYGKLGVRNRTEAARRATELKLI
jgi:LuxR family maltose regulon positive regulatory protein